MITLLAKTRINSSKDLTVIWDFSVFEHFPKFSKISKTCPEMKNTFSKTWQNHEN